MLYLINRHFRPNDVSTFGEVKAGYIIKLFYIFYNTKVQGGIPVKLGKEASGGKRRKNERKKKKNRKG